MKAWISLVAAASLLTPLSASVLVDRGLPNSTNVNNAAGPNRSNISWQTPIDDSIDHYIVGDTFSILGNSVIDSITVFEVSVGAAGTPNNDPASEFLGVTLYYGSASSLTMNSSSYTSQLVTYQPGGENYQGSSGTFYSIYALTFSGLNWAVGAGTYGFAVDIVPADPFAIPVIHASNAALSGTPQDFADNLIRYYILSGGVAGSPQDCDTSTSCSGNPQDPPLWDKSSDLNVIIQGTDINSNDIPEPSTWLLMAAGVGATGYLRRRRNA